MQSSCIFSDWIKKGKPSKFQHAILLLPNKYLIIRWLLDWKQGIYHSKNSPITLDMTYVISVKELSSDYFIEGSTLKCGSDTIKYLLPPCFFWSNRHNRIDWQVHINVVVFFIFPFNDGGYGSQRGRYFQHQIYVYYLLLYKQTVKTQH